MVGLSRNKRTFWYSLFVREQRKTDEWGNEQPTPIIIYSKPKRLTANISAARGQTENDLFGIAANYDRTINPLPNECPINEASVLWVDKTPVIAEDGTTTTGHDYVVTQIADSLNGKAYAISKVNTADGVGVYGEANNQDAPDGP